MKRAERIRKIKEKYGNPKGEELKELVTDTFSEPYGPTEGTVTLNRLTPNVLKGLYERIRGDSTSKS